MPDTPRSDEEQGAFPNADSIPTRGPGGTLSETHAAGSGLSEDTPASSPSEGPGGLGPARLDSRGDQERQSAGLRPVPPHGVHANVPAGTAGPPASTSPRFQRRWSWQWDDVLSPAGGSPAWGHPSILGEGRGSVPHSLRAGTPGGFLDEGSPGSHSRLSNHDRFGAVWPVLLWKKCVPHVLLGAHVKNYCRCC